jgi:hypothetical protein
LPSISASKATAGDKNKPTLHCSFCKRDGHNLEHCFTVGRILANHTSRCQENDKSQLSGKPKSSSSKPKLSEKAGKTSVVQVSGDYSSGGDNSNDSGLSRPQHTACNSVALDHHQASSAIINDANLDSGCSMSMTPYLKDIHNPQPNGTSIWLTNHSSVEETHKGTLSLPLTVPAKVPTLVVPSLHEPLLAVSSICNKNFTIVFNKENCCIYKASKVTLLSQAVGQGYRKGNLYYLPSGEVSTNQTATVPQTKVDDSLLGIHNWLSHIGF